MIRTLRVALSLAFVFCCYSGFSQTVIINEVYGGGGNSGATYKNDYIELFNPTGSPVSLVGWSVQYAAATGTTWQVTSLIGTIPAGGYYLIQEAAGAGGTTNLPTPDATGAASGIAMAAGAGKVALVNSTTPLSGANPSGGTVIDLVGYGTTANGFEGAAAGTPSASLSAERKLPCVDTNNNANDFKIGAVTPQNTASPLTPAGFTTNYPKTQSVTSSGFQIVTNLDNNATTYFVILASGATAPSSAQVKAGQDGSGGALGASFKGSISVTTAATEFTANATGLSSLTAYDVYLANDRCVLSTSPVLVQVTTLAPVDLTPPNNTSGYPKVQSVTGSGFQVATNLDESGTTYFIVLQNSSATPTPAQVKAGQDDANNALAANLFGSIVLANPATEYTAVVTGLTQNTNYSVFFVSQDAVTNPNLQASVTQVNISTPVEYDETFDTCNGTVSSFSRISVTGVQIWDCTTFGNNNTNAVQINAGTSTGSTANEDWLISPLFILGTNSIVSFDNKKDFNGLPLTFKVSTDYDGVSAPSTATWADLSFTLSTNSGSTGVFVSSGPVSLSAYNGQSVYLAFVYTSGSTANTGARWAIDNFAITNAAPSYLVASTTTLGNFGYVQSPNASVSRSFDITGVGLSSDVVVTAPAGYEVSKDGNTFSSTFNFTSAEAAVSPFVFVRFKPSAGAGTVSGNVTAVNGNKTINVSVSGTEGIDPRSLTFDVVCYNTEFFGTDVHDATNVEFGPSNDALQITNVGKVLATMGADIYGVEEIADDAAFTTLLNGLPGYTGILSPMWSHSTDAPDPFFPPQKVGFIYNNSTVHVVNSRVMFLGLYNQILASNGANTFLPGYPTTENSFWSSGRLPFMLTIDVTINGATKRIRMIDIHAKSGSASADYLRRQYDVQVLHDSLNANYPNDNIILVGDYNDNVEGSIFTGHVSSYKTFVDDVSKYNVLTDALALAGAFSFPSSSSFLDHIIISNELTPAYIANSIAIEDPRNYIVNYSTTTSDHLPVTASFNIVKTPQAITFGALADKTFGDAPFDLAATSSSGLTVTYASSDPTVASISGNTVTILKGGTVNITASQAGDAYTAAAPDVVQPLVINKQNQTITFGALIAKNFGDAPFALAATSSSSLVVTYTSSNTSVATVSGSTVTIVGTGSTDITASQAGNESYNVAVDVPQTLVVNKGNQTITFGALPAKNLGDAPFTLTATSSSSLGVTYASSVTSVATVSGSTITVVGVGSTIITASQAGNGSYNAAVDVPQTLVINKQNQTITFGALAAKNVGDAPFTLAATSSSSLGVTYTSSVTSVATVSGSTVTIVGAGSTVITAAQAGNGSYNAATSVPQTLVVNKLAQTITFQAIADKTVGDAAFALSATSTSSLAVSFATTSDKVTLAGSQVTIIKAGRLTITGAQAGNTNYNAATSVDQSFCIKPAKPTVTISNGNTISPTLTSSAATGNQWYLNGNIINGATNATLNVTGAGVYKVQAKVDDCISPFSNDTPIIITGDLNTTPGSIVVYPNPANDYIEVRGIVNEAFTAQVTDMMGKTNAITLQKNGDAHRATIEHFSAGIYLLRVQDGTSVHQIKFVKK